MVDTMASEVPVGGEMTRKPLIGITVDFKPASDQGLTSGKLELNWNYAEAVSRFGGIPLLIPPQAVDDVERLATILDGWLIPGGNDIDAKYFGEASHPAVETIEDARFSVEAALYRSLPPGVPILGICYGCQFLNVMEGGTLIQHLPDVLGENDHTGNTPQVHHLKTGSKLQEVSGAESIRGKSSHHQAIKSLGKGMEVSAEHADGTIEAIESNEKPFVLGVQWHPERTMDDPATQRLFTSFIEAARENAAKKQAR